MYQRNYFLSMYMIELKKFLTWSYLLSQTTSCTIIPTYFLLFDPYLELSLVSIQTLENKFSKLIKIHFLGLIHRKFIHDWSNHISFQSIYSYDIFYVMILIKICVPGHYVPQLSQAIVRYNFATKAKSINLKGYMVRFSFYSI